MRADRKIFLDTQKWIAVVQFLVLCAEILKAMFRVLFFCSQQMPENLEFVFTDCKNGKDNFRIFCIVCSQIYQHSFCKTEGWIQFSCLPLLDHLGDMVRFLYYWRERKTDEILSNQKHYIQKRNFFCPVLFSFSAHKSFLSLSKHCSFYLDCHCRLQCVP